MLKINNDTYSKQVNISLDTLRELLRKCPRRKYTLNNAEDAPKVYTVGQYGDFISIGLVRSNENIIYIEYFDKTGGDYLYIRKYDELLKTFDYNEDAIIEIIDRIKTAVESRKRNKK